MAALIDGHLTQPLVQLLICLLPPHCYEVRPAEDAGARGLASVLHDGLETLEFVLE